jgi:DUF4097 and DUF4098 domain-containing protein YvlB
MGPMLLSGRLGLTALLSTLMPAAHAAEQAIQREYSVAGGATLKLDTYRGTIEVGQSDDARIHLRISEQVTNAEAAEAAAIFKRVEIGEKADAGAVSVVVRNPAETRVLFVWKEKERVALNYSILVPKTCSVVLSTNQGDINVNDITGSVDAKAAKGTVFLRRIDGDIRAEAEAGDLIVSRCLGSASLRVRSGNIRVGTIGRHADLWALSGDINVQHAHGGLVASAEAGNVSIGLEKEFPEQVKIKTSGGGIDVKLDPGARCRIQARSVWGKVHAALPILVRSGGDGERSLDALFNGGGPLLELHADGGQVYIGLPKS